MRILRVFPRRTNATPDDEMVRIGEPTLFDEADEVHISVAFDWDKERGEQLAESWSRVTPNVSIGGPAYNPAGDEFVAGRYLKKGHVITSRGCPNSCWFCRAWKNEGHAVREYPIHDGWILHDNNILACSIEHQTAVFKMLERQPERPRFTGGLEAKRLTAWHIEWLLKLKPQTLWFAYDTPDDYDPLVVASRMLRESGLMSGHRCMCYVLIGWDGDTIAHAERRLTDTMRLGFMPQAMLYNRKRRDWYRFQREWANRVIVGSKMGQLKKESESE